MEKRPRLLIFVGVVLFVGLVVAGYWFEWDWTGFTEQNGSTKTFWDWLQLLGILAIPVAIGMGAWVFTTKLVQAREAEHTDNQREAALQEYINKMLELLVVNDLRHSSDDDEVREIARVRTVTVLRKLDPVRKASVLQFLQETDLVNKDKRIVELVGVDLGGARLSGVNLNGARLSEANLSGANLNGANLSGANLNGANLRGTYLNDADLSGADLSEADLNEANLGWAILSGPARSRIFLGPSNLSGANLRGAILSEANLRGANLREANLSGADLRGANPSGANFSGANLSDIDLSTVNLSDANLSNAKLSRADLRGTNLRGAKGVTDEQLGEAKSLEGAIMPDGSKHP
jgi:uncharacterized protein YjbI with pentapeptide repeats